MAELPPVSHVTMALGALIAEIESRDPVRFGCLAKGAKKRLQREPALTFVWGIHGEHESDAYRKELALAVGLLGKIEGVIANQVERPKAKGRRRRLA